REKEEIAKIKKSWQSSLDLLKDDKITINEKQKECDQYQSQLNALPAQIESLKSQLLSLERQQQQKDQEINNLKPIDRRSNKDKISKFNNEIIEIVGEIGKIKVQIGNLENKQEKYQEMLADDENYKKELKKAYEDKKLQFKNDILKSLHSLYDITSAEG
ncbi:MAG: hypothetical protein Q8889_02765, partial [Candidatus Phytoplasma australasiaticum]|nr:hypothetical protein [Candidatus Phytoplasma australasiaticum]